MANIGTFTKNEQGFVGEIVTLSFQAPETPGDYPFICSFPGHWLTMKGVMRVR